MSSRKHIEKILKDINVAPSTEARAVIDDEIIAAYIKSYAIQNRHNKMDNKNKPSRRALIRFALAAIVIAAVYFGVNLQKEQDLAGCKSPAGLTAAWAGTVEVVTNSYDQQYKDMLAAIETKDYKKASKCANEMSEVWQRIYRLSRIRLGSKTDLSVRNVIHLIGQRGVKFNDKGEIELSMQEKADPLCPWLAELQGSAWIYEVKHISKQMEEYCEGLRDAFRDNDKPVIDHCLKGISIYGDWFSRLPWFSYQQPMSAHVIKEAVQRDLKIAALELDKRIIEDWFRYVDRAAEQVMRNAENLDNASFFKDAQEFAELIDSVKKTQYRHIRDLAYNVDYKTAGKSTGYGFSIGEIYLSYISERLNLLLEACSRDFKYSGYEYDFHKDNSLPEKLILRLESMLVAWRSGDADKYVSNYNVDAFFKLATGKIQYDSNSELFGAMTKQVADDFARELSGKLDNPEQMARLLAKSINIRPGDYSIKKVSVDSAGKRAAAIVQYEYKEGKFVTYTPQWAFYDGGWWQVVD